MSACIPESIRQRLEAFCAEGKTGQITLNIHRGTIGSGELKEHLRATPEKNLTTGDSSA